MIPNVYKIGKLGKAHGVRGEVQMQFSDDVFDRTDADYVFLKIDGLLVPFFFEEYRFRSAPSMCDVCGGCVLPAEEALVKFPK